jgi:hypothetical protein
VRRAAGSAGRDVDESVAGADRPLDPCEDDTIDDDADQEHGGHVGVHQRVVEVRQVHVELLAERCRPDHGHDEFGTHESTPREGPRLLEA